MRKILILLALLGTLLGQAGAADVGLTSAEDLEQALPEAAAELLEGQSYTGASGLSQGLRTVITGAVRKSGGALKNGLALCCQILAIVLLSAVLRGSGSGDKTMVLAGVLAIGTLCAGRIASFFTMAARAIDDVAAFSGFLYPALAMATAATGAVGASSSLFGVTILVAGVMTRLAEALLLPGISCYMALMIADSAVGDGALKMAGDLLKQLLTNGLKLMTLAVTAYLSLTGVVSGSADQAAVKAAKLTISSTVPVVGSMIADASETLLVSATLVRSSLGIFGMLAVLAVCAVPVLQSGCLYLLLKGTAAAAGTVGEKELSGLIGAMAGAMGLVTGLTATCALVQMIGCVCFMRVSV